MEHKYKHKYSQLINNIMSNFRNLKWNRIKKLPTELFFNQLKLEEL